jgi:hypothetical protein
MMETSGGVPAWGINTNIQTSKECSYCGNIHGPRCPAVRSIEYYQDGTVKRVEFVPMTSVFASILGRP